MEVAGEKLVVEGGTFCLFTPVLSRVKVFKPEDCNIQVVADEQFSFCSFFFNDSSAFMFVVLLLMF